MLLWVVTAAPISFAFTTPTPTFAGLKTLQQDSVFRSETSLHSYAIDNEDEAMRMMMKANLCAHSDTCSIDEAEQYLQEVLHLQSNCASRLLTSSKVCDDVLFPSEVIAGLREKIRMETALSKQGAFRVGFNPIFLSVLAVYLSSGLFSLAHNNPDSFTMQEWWYAIRGGYLDDMVSQYMKYGGLSPIAPTSDEINMILPITLQEWWWSIRDGYVGKLASEYQNYGGLMTVVEEGSNPEDLVFTTPLTSEDWSFASRDGYLPYLITHYLRNGGL